METFAPTTNQINLATWERPRSKEELATFLAAREEACDVEDFDF